MHIIILYDGKFLGTFRFVLAKKKEVYIRKYIYFTDFIAKMGGYYSSLMASFSILSLILVNPNDNLRIFYFLKKNKPSIYKRSKALIKDSYKNIGRKINDIWDDKNIENMNGKDKFFYLCFHYGFCCKNKCCKKSKNKHFEAIDNFINENLTIDKYLEESLRNKNLDKFIEKYINEKKDININNNSDFVDIPKNTFFDDFMKNEILFRVDSLKDEEKKK